MNDLPYIPANNASFGNDSIPLEILKLRMDYAWKWFSYHAGQRTSVFNYSLIVIGIFVNAYVMAIKEGLIETAVWIAVFGAIMCGAFVMLDRRNKRLVNVGEDMLEYLEKRQLFTVDATADSACVKRGLVSRVKAHDAEKGMWGITVEAACGFLDWMLTLPKYMVLGRHGVLLPIVELAFGIAFIYAALNAPTLVQQVRPSTSKVEVKLAPDETLRAEVTVLKAQTARLQLQLTEFQKATQSSLARIEAKGTRPPQVKGGR